MVLRKVGKFLLYGCAGLLGLMLLSMLALKLALDRAPRYQAEIKSWIHGQIGYHVAFAHVSPAFRWYGPELYFERLELRSKDDRRVLARAAGGRVGADIWQLLRSGKLLAGRIELDSPDIAITRMGEDEFALASEIALAGGSSTLPALRLAELPAGTVAIRRGLVTLHGWNPALPQLELRDVTVNLRRGDGIATLALAARLPSVLGGDLTVNATARGFDSLRTLSWAAVSRAQNLSLAGWRQLLPEYLSRLGAGTGGFEAAVRGVGADLSRADVDFGATGVTAQLTQEPNVKFDRIGGALTLTHSGDRWTLLGRRVRVLRAGRRDPDSAFDVSWRGCDTGLLEVRAGASYLRAETLLPLAGLLPQKELRERLQELAFTGEWSDARLNLLRDTADAPWRLDIRARFRGVGFAAVGRAPGLRGLSGTIAGTDAGGRIDVDTHGAVFAWPAELEQPIELELLKTTLYWKRTPEELLVATPSLELRNHDAALRGRVAWRHPADGTSPLLTMVTSVDNGNAAQPHRYLPRTLLAPSALAWLNRAFVAGRLSHADVLIQGPIRHFPFRDGTGLFLVRAHMEGMTLDYKRGLAACGKPGGLGAIPQRRADRAVAERQRREPRRGHGRCTLRRLQDGAVANPCRRKRRCRGCSGLSAGDAPGCDGRACVLRRRGQGTDAMRRGSVAALQAIRSTPGIRACASAWGSAQTSRRRRGGHRVAGGRRCRRGAGGTSRRARQASGRRFSDAGSRAA